MASTAQTEEEKPKVAGINIHVVGDINMSKEGEAFRNHDEAFA